MEEIRLKERKSKTQKGITLMTLIITIIVLLILAAISIKTVHGEGLIKHAKNSSEQTKMLQEKEELQATVLKWQSINRSETTTLFDFLSNKYGINNVQLNPDNSVSVTMQSGNKYKVTETTEVTPTE